MRTADDAPAVVASGRFWSLASGSQLPVVPIESRSSPRHLAVSGDDDDDIYIMVKCLFVCMFVTKNHHFLL